MQYAPVKSFFSACPPKDFEGGSIPRRPVSPPEGHQPHSFLRVSPTIATLEVCEATSIGTSRDYHKLLPLTINREQHMALVDSGNTAANAISHSLVSRIGITGRMEPYTGPRIKTAKKDASLKVLGIIRRLDFRIMDDKGRAHRFTSQFIVIDRLSNGINLSLPWLIRHRFDQIHTEGILKRDGVRYPVYTSYHVQQQVGNKILTVEHKVALREPSSLLESTDSEGKDDHSIVEITSDESIPVYNRNPHCYRTRVPPNTGIKLTIQDATGNTLEPRLPVFEFS